MKIKKITSGFVIQTFDTEKREFTEQEFIASDQVEWEDSMGETINSPTTKYLPFEMKQPNELEVYNG